MTNPAHEADVLAPTRLRRALASPWLRSRSSLVLLAAPGVLVLLLDGHGVSWLAGLVAGASTGAWLVGVRAPSLALALVAPLAVDHGDAETREQLSLLETAGWRTIHDFEASYARYRHVAIGPGGVIVLQSQRLEHRYDADDANSQRQLLMQRRRALAAAANLRREIEDTTGRPGWVQAVVVVWSEFPAGCLQDGRCVFVSGHRLIDWLRRRPDQLSPERAAEVHAALEQLAVAAALSTAPFAA